MVTIGTAFDHTSGVATVKTTNNMDFGINFENLTLREKVCQMMAPTARQFAEYGFDTEKYPIGFFWYAAIKISSKIWENSFSLGTRHCSCSIMSGERTLFRAA